MQHPHPCHTPPTHRVCQGQVTLKRVHVAQIKKKKEKPKGKIKTKIKKIKKGYGYAKAPTHVTRNWGQAVSDYVTMCVHACACVCCVCAFVCVCVGGFS